MHTNDKGHTSPDDFTGMVIESEFYNFMPGSGLLSVDGSQPQRIGRDNTRVKNDFIVEAEALLGKLAPIPMTFDVRPIHPPFFREFTYTDVLGGVIIHTMSAEINFRLRKIAAETDAKDVFQLEGFSDKYEMKQKKSGARYPKVLFLAGTNSLDFMDESILTEIAMDPGWIVKPHPVTTDQTISDLIAMFGGDRVLNRHTSGHELLEQADVVGSTSASETFLKAALLGKEIVNVTSKAKQHILSYGSYVGVYDMYKKAGADTEELKRRMNNMLMSDYSGFITESFGTRRNTEIAKNYFAKAMELREPWRMETPQRLFVADLYPSHWKGGQSKS